ncbi:hypothetical protein FKW77_002243 [Venturia effusa]|uniref:F-box domain-containing protein n=1 Tax=Venturia effusa TaxID=50376 RepID=A0A517LEZ1_9PEZI|nr:hypothetical protein FKW77_002243 [Venturia effusa]
MSAQSIAHTSAQVVHQQIFQPKMAPKAIRKKFHRKKMSQPRKARLAYLPTELVDMIANQLSDKDIRNARWLNPNFNDKLRLQSAHRHLRHVTLLIDPDCMTRLEQIAFDADPVVAQQIEILAIERRQTRERRQVSRAKLGRAEDEPRQTLVNKQTVFVDSGEFARRLGAVLKRLPCCKAIWFTDRKHYPVLNPEDVGPKPDSWMSSEPFWVGISPPVGFNSDDTMEEKADSEVGNKGSDEECEEDDDTDDDDDDDDGDLHDESFALIGRRIFMRKQKIRLVKDGLEYPDEKFGQTAIVEVMRAILSSGIALTELRLCPPLDRDRGRIESSTLQKIVDISVGLTSQVHGHQQPRQIAPLRTLYITADVEAAGGPEHGDSVSKRLFKLLPGLVHLRYSGVCAEVRDSDFRMLIPQRAPLLHNLPSGSSCSLHKLELQHCCFTSRDCIGFLEHLPHLKLLSFFSCRLQIGEEWSDFLLRLGGSSTLNLHEISIWYATEYVQHRLLMHQQFWSDRFVCFSDPEAMHKRHACLETRKQYKVSSPANFASKLEQWAENAHTFKVE